MLTFAIIDACTLSRSSVSAQLVPETNYRFSDTEFRSEAGTGNWSVCCRQVKDLRSAFDAGERKPLQATTRVLTGLYTRV